MPVKLGSSDVLAAYLGELSITGMRLGDIDVFSGSTVGKILATKGTFLLSGKPAKTIYHHRLRSVVGSYSLNGQDAALKRLKGLKAAAQAYQISDPSINYLTYNSNRLTYGGGYVLNGLATAGTRFYYKRAIKAGTTTFTVTRQPAFIARKYNLKAGGSTFALTGGASIGRRTQRLLASSTTFGLSGQNAVFTRITPAVAPSYVATGADVQNVISSTGIDSQTLTVPLPAGFSAGQFCVIVMQSDSTFAITAPSGWTKLTQVNHPTGNNSNSLQIFYRFLVAGVANPTFTDPTHTQADQNRFNWMAKSMTFTGVNTTNPIEGLVTATGGTSAGGTVPVMSVTTLGANRHVVIARSTTSTDTTPVATGFTSYADYNSGSGNDASVSAQGRKTTTTGTYSDISSTVIAEWCKAGFALRP